MRAVGPATPSKMSSPPDSRAFRLDVPETVRWFDLDFPEVIALRRRLYPERDRYRLLAYSATDPGWLNELPADRPILVVAEGVLPYIASVDVRQLFVRLTDRLPAVLARASSPVNTWLRCALSPQRIPGSGQVGLFLVGHWNCARPFSPCQRRSSGPRRGEGRISLPI